MSLDLRLRQSPRVSMTASILILLTLLSMGVAKAVALPQTAVHPEAQARSQSVTVPSRDEIWRTLLRQPLYFERAADVRRISPGIRSPENFRWN
ncbi:hypothetical protein HDF17_001890 [Granulicella arctica]|uniref:Uncharacterized protein n=1 Tax=Granulicella arctica TaxID=940613 RepID=A0A7Y9TH74_9BACT|nr:hypothetical protein [Granulicella arctica]